MPDLLPPLSPFGMRPPQAGGSVDRRPYPQEFIGSPGARVVPGSACDKSGIGRRRWLFWLALAFCLGIALDESLEPGLAVLWGLAVTGGLATLLVWVWGRGRPGPVFASPAAPSAPSASAAGSGDPASPAIPPTAPLPVFGLAGRRLGLLAGGFVNPLLGMAVGILGGLWVHAWQARMPAADDIRLRTPAQPAQVWIEGTLIDLQRPVPGGALPGRWVVRVEALGAREEGLTLASGCVQLAAPKEYSELAEGDRVRLLAQLEAPAAAMLPGLFDYARYLARLGIYRVGRPVAGMVRAIGIASWWRLDWWLWRWSGRLSTWSESRLEPDQAALLNALVFGRREGLDAADREAFARSGTAHLLAISGLHVQALALLLWWLLGQLGCSRRKAGWAVLAVILGYTLFCGAQPAVVRAAVMIGVVVGAVVLSRPLDGLTSLGAAALSILFFRPDDLFLAGFQLSFLAVLALLTLYPTLEAAWLHWRGVPEEWIVDPEEQFRLRWTRRIRSAFLVSLAAWLGTMPVVAWHMGTLPLFSVLTNLVAVPLSSWAMLCGLPALLLGDGWLGEVLLAPLAILLGFNRWTGSWSWICLEVPTPPLLLFLFHAAVLGWLWQGRGRTVTLPRASCAILALTASLPAMSLLEAGVAAPQATFLACTRGRAALLEAPGGEAALIDCGGEGQGPRIAECLRKRGLATLGLLVLSEDSPDACGGALLLLERVAVRRAVLPHTPVPSQALRDLEELLRRKGVAVERARDGLRLETGGLGYAFLSDAEGPGRAAKRNECLLIRVRIGPEALLFLPARSGAALERFWAKEEVAGLGRLQAGVVRLTPGPGGRWPRELSQLLDKCGLHSAVVGQGRQDAGGGKGWDLGPWALARGLRLLAPGREGSIRICWPEAAGPAGGICEAFRQGRWVPLPRN